MWQLTTENYKEESQSRVGQFFGEFCYWAQEALSFWVRSFALRLQGFSSVIVLVSINNTFFSCIGFLSIGRTC